MRNKHLDSLSKKNSISSLSSGKASIQISPKTPGTPLANEHLDDDSASETMPERTVSSSTTPRTPTNQTPRSSNEKIVSDFDIIADIIANATAAASSKSGTYSSLSSGKASIASTPVELVSSSSSSTASTPTPTRRISSFFGPNNRSKSETTTTSTTPDTPSKPARSSLLFNTSLFSKKKPETEEEKELRDAGIIIKEIKSTMGKLVVPKEIANPMPMVRLEAPQHAKLTR